MRRPGHAGSKVSLALELTSSAAWLRVCGLGSGSEYIVTAAYDNTQLQPPSAVCALTSIPLTFCFQAWASRVQPSNRQQARCDAEVQA